mmetsp:Transcript_31630/g.53140  ORF Transcript_31630/g.53140 Transcript_31630/m.53140 type:complete len:174 (+) Transcript_31630:309-830(+)
MVVFSVFARDSFLLGYAYPGYKCFKDIEKNKREEWRDWMVYWLILAVFTMAERITDAFVFWFPLYSEAKVVCVVWLWHRRTQGAKLLYEAFLKPFLLEHEQEVDKCIDESRTRATDLFASYWSRAMGYAQTCFYHALQSFPQNQSAAGGRVQNAQFTPNTAHQAAASSYYKTS